MLTLNNEDIVRHTDLYASVYRSAKGAPFTEKDFLEKTIPVLSAKVGHTYPYQVKIPKSTPELLAGDLEPKQIVTIEKPIEGPFGEMWFGDCSKGIQLLCGYKNGDSRYPCNVFLGDADIHGILAGATGQGKSVTLNSIIYGANYVYAPWELSMVLCDAKIVEFKSIAMNNPMPQILAVSATNDADYLISVLQEYANEMNYRSAIFAKTAEVTGKECKKIGDFRKVTGLVMPQILIVIDEFQAMFSNAKKKGGRIASILDDFARLGRSSGVHLLLASQELGSDIPKATLSNIKVRMAMGCASSVSQAILGNPAAAENYGKKGYMILNNNGGEEGKEDANVTYRVPFPTDDQIREMSSKIIQLGHDFSVTPVMKFYDGESLITESKYKEWLSQFNVGANAIYLGEPSFVLNDPEQCVKLQLTGNDIENIMVMCPTGNALSRYISLLNFNFELSSGVQCVINSANADLSNRFNFKKMSSNNLYFQDNSYETSTFFAIARSTVYKRLMMLKADKLLYEGGQTIATPVTNKLFDETFAEEPDALKNNVSLRERFAYCLYLMESDKQIALGLRVTNGNDLTKKVTQDKLDCAKSCIQLYLQYGCDNRRLKVSSIPTTYFWVISPDRIIGIGRSQKSSFVEEWKRVLMDCTEANCRFLLFSSDISEIGGITSCMRWIITEGASDRDVSRLKISEDYPDTVSSRLAVLYDRSAEGDKCFKFKKMLHDGELIS